MNKLAWVSCLFCFATVGLGSRWNCVAKVANRTYQVSLDFDSLEMSVKTDNGFLHRGKASDNYSPFTRYQTYYLPTGFGTGLELQRDRDDLKDGAICLKQNECYLCRE